MKLPSPIKTSFDSRLLNISKNWINLEDYEEIKKINNFYRHGLIYFPGSVFRRLESLKKTMPPHGGETLRMRRSNEI